MLLVPILLVEYTGGKLLSQDVLTDAGTRNKTEIRSFQANITLSTAISEPQRTSFRIGPKKRSQDRYSIGNQAYIKLDNGNWEDASSQQAEYFHNSDTLYAELIPILDVLAKEGYLEGKNNEYTLIFKG